MNIENALSTTENQDLEAHDNLKTDHHFQAGWEGISVFGFSLVFYVLTLARSVIWGDSASFSLYIKSFYLDPASDGHPLYVVIGQLFKRLPWELAVNLNLMSAFFAALTVTLSYLIVRRLTNNRLASAAAAASLLVAHAFWAYAVVTEVYSLNAFILLLIIYLLLVWSENPENNPLLYLGAFIFGLGITNHLILGLAGIAILFMLASYRPKIFLEIKPLFIILICFAAGSSLYWGLLIHWYYAFPSKTAEIVDIATGRSHKSHMFLFEVTAFLKNLLLYQAYLFYQFPFLGFVLGWWGCFRFFKANCKRAGFLLLCLAANAVFFINGSSTYGNANYTFFVSDYAVFSLFVGLGVYYLIEKWQKASPDPKQFFAIFTLAGLIILTLYLFPITMYRLTPKILEFAGVDLTFARRLSYRNNNEFFLNPDKRGYYGPHCYANEVFCRLPQNSIFIADYTPAAVIDYYQQILGKRKDIKLVYLQDAVKGTREDLEPFISKNYSNKPIYLGELPMAGGTTDIRVLNYVRNMLGKYKILKQGAVYQVVKR